MGAPSFKVIGLDHSLYNAKVAVRLDIDFLNEMGGVLRLFKASSRRIPVEVITVVGRWCNGIIILDWF